MSTVESLRNLSFPVLLSSGIFSQNAFRLCQRTKAGPLPRRTFGYFGIILGHLTVTFSHRWQAGKHLLFIASVGDNFYWTGVTPEAWRDDWEVPEAQQIRQELKQKWPVQRAVLRPYGPNNYTSALYQVMVSRRFGQMQEKHHKTS